MVSDGGGGSVSRADRNTWMFHQGGPVAQGVRSQCGEAILNQHCYGCGLLGEGGIGGRETGEGGADVEARDSGVRGQRSAGTQECEDRGEPSSRKPR